MADRGPETKKNHEERITKGFYRKYMQGKGLDIGAGQTYAPVLESAIGVDKNYPGYNGRDLPFEDESQDYIYSSHTLEHIPDYTHALREWMRVLKPGGHLVISVPHMYLYEKKQYVPSRFNQDHRRFYTPSRLMREIEESLEPNTYRVRHLIDNDRDFDYSIRDHWHSQGCFEIECVLQKINHPPWNVR